VLNFLVQLDVNKKLLANVSHGNGKERFLLIFHHEMIKIYVSIRCSFSSFIAGMTIYFFHMATVHRH